MTWPIPPWLWLAILIGLIVLYFLAKTSRTGRGPGTQGPEAEERGDNEREAKDPYKVLGVPRDAPFDEIRRRYRERLLEVHPDRVQHLGREFRDLAERKTLELNEAFRRIQGERNRAP